MQREGLSFTLCSECQHKGLYISMSSLARRARRHKEHAHAATEFCLQPSKTLGGKLWASRQHAHHHHRH